MAALGAAPFVAGVLTASCSGVAPKSVSVPPSAPKSAPQQGRWSEWTSSPQPGGANRADPGLLRRCDGTDRGLSAAAQRLAEHQAATGELMEIDEVTFEMRLAGVPHVWPRAWSALGDVDAPETERGFVTWLGTFGDGGQRRCGLGTARAADGRSVLTVLAVDALADLKPIPRRARTGEWIELEAQLLEVATRAEVVVLGPRGAPRTVPTQLKDGRVRARFPLGEPGPWLVQVLPTLKGGPRPVLEAALFVDQPPPTLFQSAEVPGEHAGLALPAAPPAVLSMLNAAREAEGLAPLAFDERLASAAAAHSVAMRNTRRVAHDVGNGSPTQRIHALGLEPALAGENVAHASSLPRAHRALWASPSHRSNLLHPRFTHVGIGVAEDSDGSYWVCQVFASFM